MTRMTTRLLTVAIIIGTASTMVAEPKVARRQERQQQRISQGVKNGSLTPKETAHIESREAALNHEIRSDRQGNSGSLTPAERAQVNQQQNRLSNAIYRDKHNAFNQQQ